MLTLLLHIFAILGLYAFIIFSVITVFTFLFICLEYVFIKFEINTIKDIWLQVNCLHSLNSIWKVYKSHPFHFYEKDFFDNEDVYKQFVDYRELQHRHDEIPQELLPDREEEVAN